MPGFALCDGTSENLRTWLAWRWRGKVDGRKKNSGIWKQKGKNGKGDWKVKRTHGKLPHSPCFYGQIQLMFEWKLSLWIKCWFWGGCHAHLFRFLHASWISFMRCYISSYEGNALNLHKEVSKVTSLHIWLYSHQKEIFSLIALSSGW